MGVPAADVASAIEAQLATRRPEAIPAGRWKHVQRLYTTYGNVPLWLEQEGFHQARSAALLRAVLDANTDAIRLDEFPLDDLIATVGVVREQSADRRALATPTCCSRNVRALARIS